MERIRWILVCVATVITAFTLTAGIRPTFALRPAEIPVGGASVKIDNVSFGPADVKIPIGATVKWTNNDDVPHVVASDDKLFKSKPLDTDDHFSSTFTKPGTYMYYCSIHPKMTAKVVVE
jgi:plastocyanin